MIWPITVSAETYSQAKRKVRMMRTVEGAGDAVGAMLRAVMTRPGGPYPFLGCEIVGCTPLGQVIRRILEQDEQGAYILILCPDMVARHLET